VLGFDVQGVVPVQHVPDSNIREAQPQRAARGRRVDATAWVVFRVFDDAGSDESTARTDEAICRYRGSEAELAALRPRVGKRAVVLAARIHTRHPKVIGADLRHEVVEHVRRRRVFQERHGHGAKLLEPYAMPGRESG
jgi:hypothetical protein